MGSGLLDDVGLQARRDRQQLALLLLGNFELLEALDQVFDLKSSETAAIASYPPSLL
jgi:hypothetical protein